MPDTPSHVARVVRGLTQDHHIRIAALDSSPLWDGVRRGHPHLDKDACACLTELLSATALVQSRGHSAERLQLLLKGSGHAKAVVADSWPDGTIRGVLDVSDKHGGPWVSAPGLLQVMRSNPDGKPYIGNLELVEGGVAAQVEAYLLLSEQVQASLTLWCDPATGEAGGLMVEPMPHCPPERLARLIQAIEGLDVVPNWERTTDFLLDWVNQGKGTDQISISDLHYRCRCNRSSLLGTLKGFPPAQQRELFADLGTLEVRCDYCSQVYSVTREELLGEGA
ncbi:MAG: Hsp33 family molecular chaperone HslO [Acidobacteriota bacterium]|nr:Hsp33 family molecular chaperone HslO [Acidobacteriota bacterium]